MSAKFWIDPVSFASNRGFSSRELREMERLVAEHQDAFMGKWHEFFNDNSG
jgi:hypothetical protein